MVKAFAAGDGTRTREFVWGQKLEPVHGTFRISATDNTWEDSPDSQDELGACVARVQVPKTGNNYYVKFTRLRPVGERRPAMGGVMVNHPMFGNTGIGGPGMFPRLHAYVAVWGAANVVRNGKVIGRDRVALAWVGQAGRDPQGKWLFDADKSRVMAHLVVFGAMGGGSLTPEYPGRLPALRLAGGESDGARVCLERREPAAHRLGAGVPCPSPGTCLAAIGSNPL